jgi:hypothetical protein
LVLLRQPRFSSRVAAAVNFRVTSRFWPFILVAMSVAELKRAVDGLTPEQRLELAEYLRWYTCKDDPQWQAELGRRLDRSLAGQGHTAEELQQLHDKLSSEER